MGYSVLPMAIACDIVMAVGVGAEGSKVCKVANTNARFATEEFSTDPSVALDRAGGHRWSHYFQCGYKGAFVTSETVQSATSLKELNVFPETSKAEAKPLRVVVTGFVPMGSGLSSSSAFVVASCLSTAAANGRSAAFTRTELAERCCKCEWFVGTMGGGMDQAISCMGEAGIAKHVEFNPLRAHDVTLPAGATFVISNSLAVSAKALSADQKFNKRVVECKLAGMLVARELGLENWQTIGTFRQLLETLAPAAMAGQEGGKQMLAAYLAAATAGHATPVLAWHVEKSVQNLLLGMEGEESSVRDEVLSFARAAGVAAGESEAQLAATEASANRVMGMVCRALLKEGEYAPEELAKVLGLKDGADLSTLPLFAEDERAKRVLRVNDGFALRQRAAHVYAEADLVINFKLACAAEGVDSEATLQRLGKLMDASHASCRNMYECSCRELDELTEVAKKHGAIGSRMTGAGWGGSAVSLVPETKVASFIEGVLKDYYDKRPEATEGMPSSEYLFASSASAGASIVLGMAAKGDF